MYRKLLVPLDGSAYSERALPLVATLAQHLAADIVLMRAVSATVFPGVDPTEGQLRAIEEAETYLTRVASDLAARGLRVETAAPYGDAATEIVYEVGLRAIDLVVMCTHGRSGLGRWIYGSVAEQVLADCPVPVLLVRPTGTSAKFELDPARAALLIPLDGSRFAEAVLPHATGLARVLGGRIVLVSVVEPELTRSYAFAETSFVPAWPVEANREAEDYLHEVARRLEADGLVVQTIVRQGWPADVIAYWGEELQATLIVMTTHGRTGVARTLLGSVALEVVRRSPLPVMLIRPTPEAVRQVSGALSRVGISDRP